MLGEFNLAALLEGLARVIKVLFGSDKPAEFKQVDEGPDERVVDSDADLLADAGFVQSGSDRPDD